MKANPDRVRTLLVTAGSTHKQPWWWQDLDHAGAECELEHETVIVENGRLSGLLSFENVRLLWRVASILFNGRRRYRYVYTFECGWLSFAIAFLQTVTMVHRPRHVILQFIMRERQPTWSSRLKYAFMKWCFSSVDLCVCSSRAECRYYEQAFGWPAAKLAYVPLHSDPRFLDLPVAEGAYVIAAGRTFRDYATLTAAFRGEPTPLVVVAGRNNTGLEQLTPNITVRYDVPGAELMDLLSKSMAVAVPLEPRDISIGQSVVLQAMSLGKPVIVTRVNGTEDYITDMVDGLFVPPHDPAAIRAAVDRLAGDPALRERLGRAARQRVTEMYLPKHYAQAVTELLRHRHRHEPRGFAEKEARA